MASPKSNPRMRSGRTALCRRVKALGEPCWMCGLPIDPARKAGDPLSFELDELVPVSKGGDPVDFSNVKASHRCCNQWRQAKSVGAVVAMRNEARNRYGGWRTPIEFVSMMRSVKGKAKVAVKRPSKTSGTI